MWWLYEDGLRVWRGKNAGEWQSSAAELTGHLDVLCVPYSVEVRRGLTKSTQREYGFAVHIATADLPSLTAWVPSLQRKLDALAGPEAAPEPPAAP
jgi:hypothetical protein